MRTPSLALFACSLVLAACPTDPPVDDAGAPGEERDAGAPGVDSGTPPGEDGGDDDDAGTPPPPDAGDDDDAGAPPEDAGVDAGVPSTPEELATLLCEMYLPGFENRIAVFAGLAAQSFTRCTAEGALPEVSALPSGLCEPGGEFYDPFLEATTGGRVAFDVPKLTSCAATLREERGPLETIADFERVFLSQLQLVVDDPDCQAAITPLVPAGGVCRQHWDCPTGTRCEAPDLDGAELRCLAPAELGEPCANEPSLSDQTALAPSPVRSCAGGAQCVNQECVAPLAENDPCDPSVFDGDGATCETGLFCNETEVCELRRIVGGPCANDAECADGLRCGEDDTCEEDAIPDGVECEPGGAPCAGTCSVCRPTSPAGVLQCLDRGDVGDACEELDDCREGLKCGLEGTCVVAGALDEPCDDDVSPCADGFFCDSLSETCQALVPHGGACERTEQCGTVNVGCIDGVCTDRRPGDPCLSDDDCDSPLACAIPVEEADGGVADGGVADGGALEPVGACAERPRVGEPCNPAYDICEGGICEDGSCVAVGGPGNPCVNGRCGVDEYCGADDHCVALGAPGAACDDDAQCRSNLCLPSTSTCSAVPPDSCLSTKEQFLQVLSFGLLLPLGAGALRRRRRRRARG